MSHQAGHYGARFGRGWLIGGAVVALLGSGIVAVSVILSGSSPLGLRYSRCTSGTRERSFPANRSAPLFFVSGKTLAVPGISATRIERFLVSWHIRGTAVSDLKIGVLSTVAAGSGKADVLWSPSIGKSGTTLAYIKGSALEVGRFGGEGDLVTAAANGTNRRVIRRYGDSDPVWSPDGKNIAVVYDGSVIILSSAGEIIREVQGASDVNTISWSPNSKCIVASDGDSPSRIIIADVQTGATAWLTPDGVAGYYPAWSPQGNLIVYANDAGALMMAELTDGSTRQLAACPPGSCTQQLWSAWSPDGSLIAFVRNNSGTEQIFIVSSTGGTPRQVTFGPDQHISPTW